MLKKKKVCLYICIYLSEPNPHILDRNPSMQEPHFYFTNSNVKGQAKIYMKNLNSWNSTLIFEFHFLKEVAEQLK